MVDLVRTLNPPPRRCSVVVSRVGVDELGALGTTNYLRYKFTVQIAREQTKQETEDTLLHEWAHVLCWRPHHPLEGDHDAVWGVQLAAVYRQYHGTK